MRPTEEQSKHADPSQTTRPQLMDSQIHMPLIRLIDAQTWTAIVRVAELPPFLQTMDPATINGLLPRFAQFLAGELRRRVLQAINTQRFKKNFKPLAESTVKRKGHARFYQDTGFLVRNLTIWSDGQNWNVGFRAGIKHPTSGKDMTIIAKALEYGTEDGRIPARPVFLPEAYAIQRDIRKILVTWLLRNKPV